ncbi:MAG: DUF692 domain-containing protein [Aquabacterium sp.]|jgi:uncharacterized protein (UPF0276 family)|nr:DUF692 domain-containing protein [Aquabacterium sp.]
MQPSSITDRSGSRLAMRDGLPAKAGIGLKPQHFQEVIATRPEIGFFEVHAENYMVDGGPMHHWLGRICEHYPLSLHGVGLSLGAEMPPDEAHLDRLARVIDRYQPASFSEHLAWSTHREVFLNDLLPVAYDGETLARVCRHIDRVQERLGLRMLLENPSTYVEFERSTMDEATFLSEVLRRTGCGLLLDVTNAHVSCTNHGRDVGAYLDALPLAAVGEIHLAGFAEDTDAAGDPLLIDHHGSAVAETVWRLYAGVIDRIGARPTLLERDNDVPSFGTLKAEALRAQALLVARELGSLDQVRSHA